MANMSLSEQLTYSTVLIKCQYADGHSGSGTGFIVHLCINKEKKNCVPVLITNYHVVKNSVKTVFEFCKKDAQGNPIDTEVLPITYNGNTWIHHPDRQVDLCALKLADIIKITQTTKNEVFYIPLNINIIPDEQKIRNLSALEDVVMIGYPIGLSDTYNHKPIIRKGTTATHLKNNYQGKEEFLVDIACYPGSSGSPIFILNEGMYAQGNNLVAGQRLYFIGILYGMHQYVANGNLVLKDVSVVPEPVLNMPMNLGVAIKANKILEFEEYFNAIVKKETGE